MAVLVGILLLHIGQAMSVLLGRSAHLLCLFIGISTLVAVAGLRAHAAQRIPRVIKIAVPLLFYLSLLQVVSYLNNHEVSPASIAFQYVCLILFLVGCCLSLSPVNSKADEPRSLFVMVSLAVTALYAIVTTQSAAFLLDTSSRSIGPDELNAVGFAYTAVVVALALLVSGVLLRGVAPMLAGGVGAGAAVSAAAVTGSRGAIVWGAVTAAMAGVFLLRLLKNRGEARGWVLVGCGALIVVVWAAALNTAISDRWLIWTDRMESAYLALSGLGVDPSLGERQYTIGLYMQDVSSWFLIGYSGYDFYPHNILIEPVVRFGVLGWPILYAIVRGTLGALKQLIHASDLSDEQVMMLILCVFGVLQGMSSLNLEMNRVVWLSLGVFFGPRILASAASRRRVHFS